MFIRTDYLLMIRIPLNNTYLSQVGRSINESKSGPMGLLYRCDFTKKMCSWSGSRGGTHTRSNSGSVKATWCKSTSRSRSIYKH